MKTKKLHSRLAFNKVTVARLDESQQVAIKGGITNQRLCYTDPPVCLTQTCPYTCPLTCENTADC